MPKFNVVAAVMLFFSCVLTNTANAQLSIETYQNPSNLQVLSSDISPQQLRDTMYSFGQQVGLRCSKCHDFESDTPADERDYASDGKELKRVTREMMLLTESVNLAIFKIDRSAGHNRISVQCVTCHHGVSQPLQIEEIFMTTLNEDGLPSAIEQYKELRQSWYATAAYDFSAWRLGGIAQNIFDSGNRDAGMLVHALNLELNAQDGSVYYHRAESYEKQGRIEDAIANYERALKMEEDSFGFLDDRISGLRKRLEED